MATITIPKKELKMAVKEGIREVFEQEFMKFRALLSPLVSEKEQKDIEKRYNKPSRTTAKTVAIKIWIGGISFSSSSLKFLERNSIKEGFVIDKITLVLRKFKGENINIDIKKLKGEWEGFYRIRFGKIRIIANFQFENCQVGIEEIDWRGNAYK